MCASITIHHGSKRSAEGAFSFSEIIKLNVKIERCCAVDVIQLQDIDPAFRLKVLREGIPLKMENDTHYALISQAFSELQDLKISKMLATCRECSGLGLMPTKMQEKQ